MYAAWSDYRTREVSNKIWLAFAPIALAVNLTAFLLYEPSQLPQYGVSFAITTAISLALFYGGGFGGADAKALMCIALILFNIRVGCSEPNTRTILKDRKKMGPLMSLG